MQVEHRVDDGINNLRADRDSNSIYINDDQKAGCSRWNQPSNYVEIIDIYSSDDDDEVRIFFSLFLYFDIKLRVYSIVANSADLFQFSLRLE